MPTAARLTMSDEPPALTNGRVMPVTGRSDTTTPMFTKACTVTKTVMPAASSPPNVSGAPSATRSPR